MYIIKIKRDLCKSCGLCVEFCPRKLLLLDTTLNRRGVHPAKFDGEAHKCTGCGSCAAMCPDAAIEIEEVPDTDDKCVGCASTEKKPPKK